MYSNCLLQSIKQYILNPTNIKIHKRGSWLDIFQLKWHVTPLDKWKDARIDQMYFMKNRETSRN